ncbi:MAG: ORF6N domain-containing protein [Bacteroidetes bacterium]|nr:ORF6N domain-containing protein [Bacteroidota bacterium]MBU2636061.1 ORF6N domain-containing protein [Bacteroidota bacterium]
MNQLVPKEVIEKRILLVRGQKVMLDFHLAVLSGVPTKRLNEQVRHNIKRFPEDFMFQLTKEEFKNLIFHFGISRWGGTRKLPYAFTEQGVAMLSSVLNSDRANLKRWKRSTMSSSRLSSRQSDILCSHLKNQSGKSVSKLKNQSCNTVSSVVKIYYEIFSTSICN